MLKRTLLLFFCVFAMTQTLFADAATSGTCGDQLTWTVSKSEGSTAYDVLTISGTGPMNDYGKEQAPWFDEYGYDIAKIVIEEGVTTIGTYAFYELFISEITLPNSLQTIGSYAFQDCSTLNIVRIGTGLTRIAADAFRGCTYIGVVYCAITDASQLTWEGNNAAWQFMPGKNTLFRVDNPSAWSARFPNANVTFTQGIAIDGTGLSYEFMYDDGTPTLHFYKSGSGSSEIPGSDANDYAPAWSSYRTSVQKIIVDEGITAIGDRAFQNFTSLKEVVIGKDVESTGKYILKGTSSTFTCTFEEGSEMLTLGASTFAYSGVEYVELPSGLTTIGDNAFEDSKLKSVALPDGVTSIGRSTFLYCLELESVYLGQSLQSVGEGAFAVGYSGEFPEPMSTNKLAHIYCPSTMVPTNWALATGYETIDFASYDGNVADIGTATHDHTPKFHIPYDATNLSAWQTYFSGLNVDVVADIRPYYNISTTADVIDFTPTVGSGLTVTVSPKPGYVLTGLTATAGETALDVNPTTKGTYTFTMPKSEVILTPVYEECKFKIYGYGAMYDMESVGNGIYTLTNQRISGDYLFMVAAIDPASTTAYSHPKDYLGSTTGARIVLDDTNWAEPIALSENDSRTTLCLHITDEGDYDFRFDLKNYTLSVTPAVTLQDDDNNSTAITSLAGKSKTVDVTLSGRTLYKDGSWNTLCLPFSLTADQVTNLLAPDALMELDTDGSASNQTGFDPASGTLSLYFKNATSIEAGKPYIVKWNSGSNINDPVFPGVTVTSTTPTTVTANNSGLNAVEFIGTYDPTTLTQNDKSCLYIGATNTLYYPTASDFKVNAFRAYFHVNLNGSANGVRSFVLNFLDEQSSNLTGITTLSDEGSGEGASTSGWYDLQGRRLSGKPTARGTYVNNGRKVVIMHNL